MLNTKKLVLLAVSSLYFVIIIQTASAFVLDKAPLEWLAEGDRYFGAGDYENALRCIKEAKKIDSAVPELYELRGAVYAEQGEYYKALNDLNKAIEYNPLSLYSYLYRGVIKLDRGDTNSALDDFNMALVFVPDFAPAKSYRGRVYAIRGDTDTGLADLNDVISSDAEPFEKSFAYYLRSQTYIEMEMFTEAEADIVSLENMEFGGEKAIYLRYQLEWTRGNKDKALEQILALASQNEISADETVKEWASKNFESDPELHNEYLADKANAVKQWGAAAYYFSDIEEYDRAIECVNKAIGLEPSDEVAAKLFFQRGMLYANEGDIKQAKKDADKATKLDKNYAKPYLLKTIIHTLNGKPGKARKDMERAIKIEPNNADYSVILAIAYFAEGEIYEAFEEFEYALEIDPDNKLALIHRAKLNFELAYITSLFNYQKQIFRAGGIMFIVSTTSYAKYELNKFTSKINFRTDMLDAIKDLDKALIIYDQDPEIYFTRANIYSTIKMYNEAIKDYNEVIHLPNCNNFTKAQAYFYKAQVYNKQKKSKKAFNSLSNAVNISPEIRSFARSAEMFNNSSEYPFYALLKDPEALTGKEWAAKAEIRLDHKEYSAASIFYTYALEREPFNEEWRKERGLAYLQGGKYTSAIKDFDNLIEDGFADPVVYGYRGISNAQIGRYSAALPDLNKAIEAKPDYSNAYTYRGFCFARTGEYEKAKSDLAKAVDLSPTQAPTAIYITAWIDAALGNREQMIQNLTTAIALDSNVKNKARSEAVFAKYKDDEEFNGLIR